MTGEEVTMIWLDGTGVFHTGLLLGAGVAVAYGAASLILTVARHLWRRAWGL